MATVKFSNVLLEHNPRSVEYPSLYCKSDVPWLYDQEVDRWRLSGKGTFDFTTYFNSLSVQKLAWYASANAFSPSKADLKQFKARKQDLRQTYEGSRARMTSVGFWKEYLGMAD